jgi:hypothetical protein
MTAFINTSNLTVKSEPKAVIKSRIRIHGVGTLPVEIIGDFTEIPAEHHELFLRAMTTLYLDQAELAAKPASKPARNWFQRRWTEWNEDFKKYGGI